MASRAASTAAALAGATIAVASTIEVGRQSPWTSLDRNLPPGVLVIAAGALAAAVAGTWLLRDAQPAVPIGLTAMLLGLSTPLLAGVAGLSPAWRAAAVAAPPLATAGIAQVALRWTPTSRAATRALVAVLGLVGAALAVHVVGYDPFRDPICARTCVQVDPWLGGHISTRQSQTAAGLLTIAAGCTALAGLTWARRARPPMIVIAGAVAATMLSIAAASAQLTADGSLGPWHPPRVAIPAAGVLSLGLATTLVGIRLRRVRLAVGRLLAALSLPLPANHASPGVHSVQFAEPGGREWIDLSGRPTRGEPGLPSVVVSDATGPLLRVAGQGSKELEQALATESRATWLALRNAQLAAVTRARVAEVQASRRRVCSASDAERQRIERDLHDGAQQRLVSAAFHLSLVRARLPDDPAVLGRAETTLRDAVRDLRRLAHGLFPSLLANDGLHAALDELVRGAEVPTTLDIGDDDGIGTDIAMAAYATVAAALDEAARPPRAHSGHVTVQRGNGAVVVAITVSVAEGGRPAPDLTEVDDRAGALGGRLWVDEADGLRTVTVEIPCG